MTESKRERAITMRRDGATYQQICDRLNVSMGMLCGWIREAGLTSRLRTTAEDRARAVELRKQGRTYAEIERATGVPKSTLSNHLKDIPLTAEHAAVIAEKQRRGAARAGATLRARRIAGEARTLAASAAEIGEVTDRELFIAGVLLYWAEGTKSKPWSRGHHVTFVNSDPGMVRLFLRWLELVDVGRDRLVLTVQIHERADIDHAHRFWSQIAGVPVELFRRPTLKRHNPRTTRRNIGDAYVGCLRIDVAKSTELYLRIAGWYEGILTIAP
ncbi:MAG TPA: hypothetical protein VGB64_03135 [Actinomycetota bacterium]